MQNFVKFRHTNRWSNLYINLKKRSKCGIINSILEKGSTKGGTRQCRILQRKLKNKGGLLSVNLPMNRKPIVLQVSLRSDCLFIQQQFLRPLRACFRSGAKVDLPKDKKAQPRLPLAPSAMNLVLGAFYFLHFIQISLVQYSVEIFYYYTITIFLKLYHTN